jgi:VIT1/CCC1 family predicted Fe2+/Mn2+ transporter
MKYRWLFGGILTIAIADSFSDALGIHISEESENKHTNREIWEATISTLVFKFLFAITFLAPILLFPLSQAIILCLVWGLGLLCAFSYYIAKEQHAKAWKVILEHLLIAVAVIILTHYVGVWIGLKFA